MQQPSLDEMETFLRNLQDRICDALEAADGTAKFREDLWERPGGGGGRTRVIADGALLEKGGVNFSKVHGDQLPSSATAHRPELAGQTFTALGVSLVLHSRNPYVPIVHMNYRFFSAGTVWGFGGGARLTPIHCFWGDAPEFHYTT